MAIALLVYDANERTILVYSIQHLHHHKVCACVCRYIIDRAVEVTTNL